MGSRLVPWLSWDEWREVGAQLLGAALAPEAAFQLQGLARVGEAVIQRTIATQYAKQHICPMPALGSSLLLRGAMAAP